MLITDPDITDKDRTVCITGPKPDKLPDNGSRNSQTIKALKSVLYKAISDSADEGYNCFVTGFTEGVELWAGEIVLGLRSLNKDIKLIIVSPYAGYVSRFRNEEKYLAGNITLQAERIINISEKYTGGCIRQRNEYMIRLSGKLIAITSDEKTRKGTAIDYAERSGIVTRIINVRKFEEQLREENARASVQKYRRLIF